MIEETICSRCNKPKTRDDFYTSHSGKRVGTCKDCRSNFNRSKNDNLRVRFGESKNRAIRDGRIWTISFEWYQEQIKLPCHYCGYPIAHSGKGLDRKDSGEDYHESNCVPCCTICNSMGSDFFTYTEKIEHGILVKKQLDTRKEKGLPIFVNRKKVAGKRGAAGNSSNYKGVSKTGKFYRVRMRIKGIKHDFGSFENEIEAAHNYDYHALELRGKETHLNFPDYDYGNFVPQRPPVRTTW